MDLRQLRYFVAVIDTGSISKAAHRLFIRQPTLSEHIRRLEAELGASLLVRAATGVVPTRAGEVLFTRARELIAAVEQLTQAVKQRTPQSRNPLKIGFTPSLLELLLPVVGTAWNNHELAVQPVELSAQAQLAALTDGDLDYGFVRLTQAPQGLKVIGAMEDPWVIASHDPVKAGRKQKVISLAAFADSSIVVARDGPSSAVQEQVAALCAAAGFSSVALLEASTVQGALSMVRGQIGPAVLPSVAVLASREGLHFCPLREQSVRGRLMFLGSPQTRKSELLEALAGESLSALFTQVQRALRSFASSSKDAAGG